MAPWGQRKNEVSALPQRPFTRNNARAGRVTLRGLLRKAITIHAQGNPEKTAHTEDPQLDNQDPQDESTGISVEERRQITDQIDRLMAENRIEISPQNLSYVAKRNGALIPLFGNIAILSVAIIALLVISHFLNREEQTIATGGAAVLTAESKLIAALKQESSQQLQLRDRTIMEAQSRLAAITREKDQLRGQTDSIIRARERELKGEFDRNLAAERDRLENQGMAAASVELKSRAFEEAQKTQLEQQLAASREQAEAQLAARQQAIVSLEMQYQRDIEAARQERIRVQSEARQKEAELQSQYEQKAQQVESEQARVGAELAQLHAEQGQEKLVLDQLTAGYSRVNDSLQASQYGRALQGLASLRRLLDEPSLTSVPAIQRRRSVELFLIGSLEELVRNRQLGKSTDNASSAQASSLFGEVADLVRRGDQLSHSGDVQGARMAYETAMAKIPPIAEGFARLQDLRNVQDARNVDEATSRLRQANVFYQAGNYQAAIDRYQQSLGLLLGDKALARQFTDSLAKTGYRIFAGDELDQLTRLKTVDQKRQELNARLRDIRAQYKAYVALVPKSSATDPSSPESLATLLQAKILLRQVLDTEPVRSQYPDLGAKTDRYFDAVSARGRDDGRRETLVGLDSLLGKAQSGDKTTVQNLAQLSVSGEQDPLLRLLDRLQAMLQ